MPRTPDASRRTDAPPISRSVWSARYARAFEDRTEPPQAQAATLSIAPARSPAGGRIVFQIDFASGNIRLHFRARTAGCYQASPASRVPLEHETNAYLQRIAPGPHRPDRDPGWVG